MGNGNIDTAVLNFLIICTYRIAADFQLISQALLFRDFVTARQWKTTETGEILAAGAAVEHYLMPVQTQHVRLVMNVSDDALSFRVCFAY